MPAMAVIILHLTHSSLFGIDYIVAGPLVRIPFNHARFSFVFFGLFLVWYLFVQVISSALFRCFPSQMLNFVSLIVVVVSSHEKVF